MPRHNLSGRSLRAFTLVEALVASAIIALLIGALVPALSATRASAREAACMAQQRRLHTGAMTFAAETDEAFPGINVTGMRYLQNPVAAQALLGTTHRTNPTSTFDWISPVMGHEAKLSANRARRTKQIFEDLGCPEANTPNKALWGQFGALADRADFETLLAAEGIRQTSYLSPASFHLIGKPENNGQWTAPGRKFLWSGPAVTPGNYQPRLYKVGAQLSAKVFVADGTRYLAAANHLDFDIHPNPQYFGSFTTSGPIYIASRAYGRATTSVEFAAENHSPGSPYPHNTRLSYRHRGRIMALYFDGHAGAMDETESKTNAAPWYPGGSIFTGLKATGESLQFHNAGSVDPNNPADVRLD